MRLEVVQDGARRGVRLTFEDQGPGIADVQQAMRYALTEMVRAADPAFRTVEASDGMEALEVVRHSRPDAIFLDLHMPRSDGFNVFGELSSNPRTRDIPVLISTSFSLDEAERSRLSGARAILSKSQLSLDIVRTALSSAFRGSR